YGPSGDQAQAVLNGLHADVVAFSLEPDMTRLVKARLVGPSWKKNTTHGIVTRSVVVFVLRNGNPKHIRDWEDLIKPGVQIVTPNAKDPKAAKAFVSFLRTSTAQTIFAQNGFRPVIKSVIKKFSFPVRPWLFTIQRFGGWAKVDKRFFDPRSSVMSRIEAGL